MGDFLWGRKISSSLFASPIMAILFSSLRDLRILKAAESWPLPPSMRMRFGRSDFL